MNKEANKKSRLVIDVTPEAHYSVKMLSFFKNMTISGYVLKALKKQIKKDLKDYEESKLHEKEQKL